MPYRQKTVWATNAYHFRGYSGSSEANSITEDLSRYEPCAYASDADWYIAAYAPSIHRLRNGLNYRPSIGPGIREGTIFEKGIGLIRDYRAEDKLDIEKSIALALAGELFAGCG